MGLRQNSHVYNSFRLTSYSIENVQDAVAVIDSTLKNQVDSSIYNEALWNSPPGVSFIVYLKSNPIACILSKQHVHYNTPIIYILALGVKQAYRCQSIATYLLGLVKFNARQLGFRLVALHVLATNYNAIRVYLKNGFQAVSDYENGNPNTHMLMCVLQ
ncbi:hypothetical protein GJ496_003344 [Pomphorhynchus laevis]|nr:hypothetical protein GJ496_003344 [Pomphorhynchus laevis]